MPRSKSVSKRLYLRNFNDGSVFIDRHQRTVRYRRLLPRGYRDGCGMYGYDLYGPREPYYTVSDQGIEDEAMGSAPNPGPKAGPIREMGEPQSTLVTAIPRVEAEVRGKATGPGLAPAVEGDAMFDFVDWAEFGAASADGQIGGLYTADNSISLGEGISSAPQDHFAWFPGSFPMEHQQISEQANSGPSSGYFDMTKIDPLLRADGQSANDPSQELIDRLTREVVQSRQMPAPSTSVPYQAAHQQQKGKQRQIYPYCQCQSYDPYKVDAGCIGIPHGMMSLARSFLTPSVGCLYKAIEERVFQTQGNQRLHRDEWGNQYYLYRTHLVEVSNDPWSQQWSIKMQGQWMNTWRDASTSLVRMVGMLKAQYRAMAVVVPEDMCNYCIICRQTRSPAWIR